MTTKTKLVEFTIGNVIYLAAQLGTSQLLLCKSVYAETIEKNKKIFWNKFGIAK